MQITPFSERWLTFWKECDQAKVWLWKKRYQNPDILDGYSWKVDIRFGNKSVDSSGSNAGPEGLNNFLEAVSKLMGGIEFN